MFADPPQPQGNPIDRFGYEIGRPGIINIEIEANPKPKLAWKVRGESIKEGDADSTGRIQSEYALDLVSPIYQMKNSDSIFYEKSLFFFCR